MVVRSCRLYYFTSTVEVGLRLLQRTITVRADLRSEFIPQSESREREERRREVLALSQHRSALSRSARLQHFHFVCFYCLPLFCRLVCHSTFTKVRSQRVPPFLQHFFQLLGDTCHLVLSCCCCCCWHLHCIGLSARYKPSLQELASAASSGRTQHGWTLKTSNFCRGAAPEWHVDFGTAYRRPSAHRWPPN